MSTSHELPASENNEQLLDEELETKLNALLLETADQLELFSAPDEITYETQQATFGRFNDGQLNATHNIIDGKHTGTIYFSSGDSDETERNFLASNYTPDTVRAQDDSIWTLRNKKRVTSRRMLQMLEREWPIGDSDERDEIRKLVHPGEDKADANAEVSAETVLARIEKYALLNQTGTRGSELLWRYDEASESPPHQSVVFEILNDGHDSLRRIETSITIDYPIFDTVVPLTCHINRDEIGNITLSAEYISPKTEKKIQLPINDSHAILEVATTLLEDMVESKSQVA